jgi:low temperature requirement protein LtrA
MTTARAASRRAGWWARFARVEASEGDHAVTPLELFFDLVFVFAITNVTAFMAHDLSWRSLLRGLVMIALLWWAWCSYAWLGNQARADEGVVRAALVLAMAAMFLVALAIPEAWDDHGGGLSAPVLLAVSIAVVRGVHLATYSVAARGDVGLRRTLVRTAVPVAAAAALLVVGAVLGGVAQTALWLLALAVDYIGVYVSGAEWRLPSPAHFTERHGLMIIIALGESLVAIGVGLNDQAVTGAVVLVALLGVVVAVGLWWAYFDVVAPVAEHVLASKTGADRIRLARDSFTYLHFPMVAGIIFLALGLKKVAEYVGDTEHHHLADPLPELALLSAYWGVAVYLLAHLAFRLRNIGSVNRPRLLTAAVLLMAPLAVRNVPALGQLAIVAAVMVALIVFETVRYAEARQAIRHGQSPGR